MAIDKKKVRDGIQFASVVGLIGTAVVNIIDGVRDGKKSAEPAEANSNPAPEPNVVEAPTQE